MPFRIVRCPDLFAFVNILGIEIQLLADQFQVFLPALRQVLFKVSQSILRIPSQDGRITQPGHGKSRTFFFGGKIRLPGCFHICRIVFILRN